MAGMHAWKSRSDEERHTSRVKTLLTSFLYPTENDSIKTNPPVDSILSSTGKSSVEIQPDEVKPSEGVQEHTSFITRLETYTRWPWLGKPQQLSPVCCARLGWQRVQQDMLQCVTCGAFVSVHLPHVTQPAVYEACIERMEENLLSAHKDHCTWTLVPTPVSVMCAEWTSGDQAVRSFVDRLSTYKKLQGNMPVISEDTKRTMGIPEASLVAVASLDTASTVPGDGDRGDEPRPSQPDSAATCALLGWTANDSSSTLRCRYCQREIGTWNFMPRTLEVGSSPSHDAATEETEFVFDNYAPNVHLEESDERAIESRDKVEGDNASTHDAINTKQTDSDLLSQTTDKCFVESAQEAESSEHNDKEEEASVEVDMPRAAENDKNTESKNLLVENDDMEEEQANKHKIISCIPEIIITQADEEEDQKSNCCIPEIIISQPDTDEECSRETSSTSYTDKSEEDVSDKTSSEESGPGFISHKRKLSEEESECIEPYSTETGDESDGQASTCSMQNTKKLLKARIKRKRAECLDPVGEHHVWCPWVASSLFILSGGATESIPPGWSQLLETLLKHVHIRDNPGRQVIQGAKQVPLLENVHKIRQQMRNWKSPALSLQKADRVA